MVLSLLRLLPLPILGPFQVSSPLFLFFLGISRVLRFSWFLKSIISLLRAKDFHLVFQSVWESPSHSQSRRSMFIEKAISMWKSGFQPCKVPFLLAPSRLMQFHDSLTHNRLALFYGRWSHDHTQPSISSKQLPVWYFRWSWWKYGMFPFACTILFFSAALIRQLGIGLRCEKITRTRR